jgi:hypothetical protein
MAKDRKASPKPRAPSIPKRYVQVRFYRLSVNNSPWQHDVVVPLSDWHGLIDGREWTDEGKAGRYYTSGDGTLRLSAWPSIVTDQLRMIVSRYIPDTDTAFESKGRLDFVQLAEGQEWIALSYCVIFSDGTVGIIESLRGPTPAQIASYIQEKAALAGQLELASLSYHNPANKLARMKYASRVEMQVRPGSLLYPNFTSDDDIDLALSAASKMKDAKVFRFVIETEKKEPLAGVKERVLALLSGAKITRESTPIFSVSGPDAQNNKNIPVDLLKAIISVTKSVPVENKALNPESAFRAIAEAFAENREELKQLPSVTLREVDDRDGS